MPECWGAGDSAGVKHDGNTLNIINIKKNKLSEINIKTSLKLKSKNFKIIYSNYILKQK